MIDDDLKQMLSTKFTGMKLDILENEINNSETKKEAMRYSPAVMEFALTLHFLSPKAYNFARKHLCLPSKTTLRRHQSVDGEPGWTSESFSALKADKNKSECILILDGIHLKSHVDFVRVHGDRVVVGYADYGAGPCVENGELATEALVLMAVGVIQAWRMPLAYFLSNGALKAVQQEEVLKEAISLLHNVGVQVRCIVCDGTSTNISTLELLGAKIPDSPFFLSQYNAKIYTVLDAAHMIKLARNCFARDILKDGNGERISWQYVDALFKVQKEEGLHLANKLTMAHVVEWNKRKMKVKLATQVLSRSVSLALEFLKTIGHSDFQKCEPTIQFIRLLDELFDRVNAHSPFASGSKQAITRENIKEVDTFFKSTETSLRELMNLEGKPIIQTKLHTFVIGFITCMRVIISLSKDLFQEHSSETLWYFIPYRLSQDSLEHFFGDIRLRGGWCQNPTPVQLRYSYRALVSNRLRLHGISQGRNCIEQEEDPLILDDGLIPTNVEADDEVESNRRLEFLRLLQQEWPTDLRGNIIYYMAGWVARSVARRTKCVICKENLFLEKPFNPLLARLVNLKQQGGLCHPARSVYRVIHLTDRALELELLRAGGQPPNEKFFLKRLSNSVFEASTEDRIITNSLSHDASFLDQHSPNLIKALAFKYASARMGHLTKQITEQIKGASSNQRNQLTRLTIFKGL